MLPATCATLCALYKQIKSQTLPHCLCLSLSLCSSSKSTTYRDDDCDNDDHYYVSNSSNSGCHQASTWENHMSPSSLSTLSVPLPSRCQVQHLINHFLSAVCLHFYTLLESLFYIYRNLYNMPSNFGLINRLALFSPKLFWIWVFLIFRYLNARLNPH